jgi:hypothetical protein
VSKKERRIGEALNSSPSLFVGVLWMCRCFCQRDYERVRRGYIVTATKASGKENVTGRSDFDGEAFERETVIEVLQTHLNLRKTPKDVDQSEGRFLVVSTGL